jgi:hypothetical protein
MASWGKMSSFLLSKDDLSKKDDDHGQRHPRNAGSHWAPSRPPRRSAIRTYVAVAAFVFLVILFFKNIPTGLGPDPRMRRPNYAIPDSGIRRPPPPEQAIRQQQPQINAESKVMSTPERNFNGPVKFNELAQSLHAISATKGSSVINKNILFAAASLKSASALLPVACQMGMELKSYVNFALMSRSEIDLDELRRVNGIDNSCNIIFHGASSKRTWMGEGPLMFNRCSY